MFVWAEEALVGLCEVRDCKQADDSSAAAATAAVVAAAVMKARCCAAHGAAHGAALGSRSHDSARPLAGQCSAWARGGGRRVVALVAGPPPGH